MSSGREENLGLYLLVLEVMAIEGCVMRERLASPRK